MKTYILFSFTFLLFVLHGYQIPIAIRIPDKINEYLFTKEKEIYTKQEVEEGVYKVLMALAVTF